MSTSPFDLSGRVAVVVGGTTGIGRAISLALAAAGADVVATSRREPETVAVTDEIRALGRRTFAVTSDIRDRATLVALEERVRAELGAAAILVNAAGITQRVPALDWTEESWNNILDINLTGVLRTCQIFSPAMIAAGYGRIVNIASLSSFVSFHEVAAYSASKSGVASLTRSLAVEFSRKGVLVNAIAPGIFPTALNSEFLLGSPRGKELLLRTPMARFGKVEEVGGAAVFLASDAASFIAGAVIPVDGGFLASGVNQ